MTLHYNDNETTLFCNYCLDKQNLTDTCIQTPCYSDNMPDQHTINRAFNILTKDKSQELMSFTDT